MFQMFQNVSQCLGPGNVSECFKMFQNTWRRFGFKTDTEMSSEIEPNWDPGKYQSKVETLRK